MQTKQAYPGMMSHMPKNSYTKKTNKLVNFSILRHNLSKFQIFINRRLISTSTYMLSEWFREKPG